MSERKRGGAKLWDADAVIGAIQEWAREYGRPPTTLEWNPWLAAKLGRHALVERYHEGFWPNYKTVVRYCGSWRQAIIDAGFTPNEPGRPVS